jgi:tetratricopeptide (TPR) repeat protein
MNLAKEAYEKAMEIVPENQQSAIHLSKVYFNYAYYLKYKGSEGQLIANYIEKALNLAQKFAYIPFDFYYALTVLGNEMLDDRKLEFAKEIFIKAREIGESLGINIWYAIFKLGNIYKEEKEIDKALEYYLQSAQLENTSEGWGTRRDSIKQLMKDYNIKKDKNSSLYEKCLQARIQCSKKAYKLNPNDYKNCGDYGEDLSKMGHFQDAIPVLEKGANLILQDSELTEPEKREKVNWLYQEIGFCYRNIGDYPKAEEFFDKSAETEDSAIGYLKHVERMSDLTKYEKAVISFQKFIEKFPSSEEKEKEKIFRDMADILEKVATSYENLHEEGESVLILKDYADVSFYSNPKSDARVYGSIGNRLMKKKKFLEARECFLKAIRLLPDDAQNLSQLVYISYQFQKWEECKICSHRAYSIRKDPRDKMWLTLCPKKHENEHRTYDFSKIEDLLDLAVIEELNENNEKALIYYSYALTTLEKQGVQDDAVIISKYKFIGDALWSLGKEENTLEIYKEIKDMGTDYEKVIAETIYWFLSVHKSMKNTFIKREAISIKNLQDNFQILARYLASEKRYGDEERIKKAIAIGSSYLKSNPEDKVIRQAYLELVRKKGLFDIEVIKQALEDAEEWMKKHSSNQLFQDYICFVENIKKKGLNVEINVDQVKEFGYKFINSIKDGRNAQAIIDFANYLTAEKYFDEAGKIYENLLKIKTDPKTKSNIYFSYGQMLLGQAMNLEFTKVERLEKLKEVEEKFRKAFRINTMHYMALVFLFITLKEQRREDVEKIFKDAEAIMRRVKKKKKEKASLGEISYKIGNFYLKFDRYEDAIYWLRLARQKDLENFVNWWKLGEAKIKHALILKEKGFHEQSKDLLNKSLSNLKTSLEKAPKFLQLPASKEIPELIRKCENHLQNYNNKELKSSHYDQNGPSLPAT